jgi:hypothetical protein
MRAILTVLLALALAACASAKRLDAAGDVHALLLSIRDDDQATFERHVDRNALKGVLQAKLEQESAKDPRVQGIARLLGPSIVDFAGDALIQPRTFKMVAEQYGYTEQTKIPGPVAIAGALKTLPDGRVCAVRKKDGPCTLVFTKVDGTWKLSGFEGDLSMLRLKL